MADENKPKKERTRVVWDEGNLESNANYFKENPVTKFIDEPKTPYEPDRAMDEEGNFLDEDPNPNRPPIIDYHARREERERAEAEAAELAAKQGSPPVVEEGGHTTWDPNINHLARKVKMEMPMERHESASSSSVTSPTTDGSGVDAGNKKKRVRPVLAPALTEEEIAAREKLESERTFKTMRKAVYADEGKNFKALLAKANQMDDEEDDE